MGERDAQRALGHLRFATFELNEPFRIRFGTATRRVDNFQGCLPTDRRAQQRQGQGFLRATGSQHWKSPRTAGCRRPQSLSNRRCRTALPHRFGRHVRSFYRLHLISTRFGGPGSSTCCPPASSPRRQLDRVVRRLRSRNDGHPSLDADRHQETSYLVRYVPEHPLPRVLPSPRLPALRVARVVAHTRLLRAYCCALPSRTLHSGQTPVLGESAWRALADPLAPNQSWSVTP